MPSLARASSSSSSNLTFTMKPPPPKAHLHKPIPASALPRGYLLGGTHAGVKKKAGILDLALAVSTTSSPAAAAGVFTRNAACAAPVQVCTEVLALRPEAPCVRAVVTNSGCANAVTGEEGLKNAWEMATITSKSLNLQKEALVMVTF